MKTLFIILSLLALPLAPARAQVMAPFVGEWAGEGQVTLGTEPPQRFQCRLRLAERGAETVLDGRCANTQGSTSFTYALVETAPGVVEGRQLAASGSQLPDRLDGQSDAAGRLTLAGGSARFVLARQGAGLVFTLAGEGAQGRAEGTVTLAPR